MQYAGWLVSCFDQVTKDSIYKGPFCTIDLAQNCAKNCKNKYSSVKIYHLVLEHSNQV